MARSPGTRIITNARSSLQGSSVLLWGWAIIENIRRDDAKVYFRRTTLSEEDEVQENGTWQNDEAVFPRLLLGH